MRRSSSVLIKVPTPHRQAALQLIQVALTALACFFRVRRTILQIGATRQQAADVPTVTKDSRITVLVSVLYEFHKYITVVPQHSEKISGVTHYGVEAEGG